MHRSDGKKSKFRFHGTGNLVSHISTENPLRAPAKINKWRSFPLASVARSVDLHVYFWRGTLVDTLCHERKFDRGTITSQHYKGMNIMGYINLDT